MPAAVECISQGGYDPTFFEQLAQVEDRHFWFRARNRLISSLVRKLTSSLQPGYLVVFTGIYGSRSDADAGVSTARQAGFGGAYSRQIAR